MQVIVKQLTRKIQMLNYDLGTLEMDSTLRHLRN